MPDVKLTRHLPGVATHRDFMGRVKFIHGTVIYVSEWSIAVLTDSKIVGLQRLIGETYIYWCPRCETSVWEVERQRSQGACPHCRQQLGYLQAGDKIKLHFRVGVEKDSHGQMIGGGAAWWGEKIL